MSRVGREQQEEFEEIIGKFMEGAADWESQGWARPEIKQRVRGAITTRGLPTRGAVRTRGAAMPTARAGAGPSTISELVEVVKPQLSKASLIFVLDGDYNEAAAKFCNQLSGIIDKEPAAWWIRPDGQEPPQWPWSDVVELDWRKARDRQMAESLGPDIVFVSASPQGTQVQRAKRWQLARSIVVEKSPEVAPPALGDIELLVFVFTKDGALCSYEREAG
jgi:hypothetical protein